MPKIEAIGFDFDSTLCEKFTDHPLPGVIEKVRQIPGDLPIVVITNQAGPVYRKMGQGAIFPTTVQVYDRLMTGLLLIFGPKRVSSLYIATAVSREYEYDMHCEKAEIDVQQEFRHLAHISSLRALKNRPYISADPDKRKPRPGMIEEACREIWVHPESFLYIGDMETDEQAATMAGAQFHYAKDYFGW